MKFAVLVLSASVFALGACQSVSEPKPDVKDAQITETLSYDAALNASYRSDEDKAKDDVRKPAQTLTFMDIHPGDTVLELEAGGGYFTALLAASVGESGKVYMQNPAAFDRFWGGGDPPRMKTLPANVTYVRSQFDAYDGIPDGSVDKVTWIMGPHELWYKPEGAPEGLGDPDLTFREIARVLKDGGTLVVQDHRAATGSDTSTGGDTHRIDQNHIDMLAASAGLIKTEETDLFAHPDDDLTLNVFNEAIRGKTDQFLVKYEKDGTY